MQISMVPGGRLPVDVEESGPVAGSPRLCKRPARRVLRGRPGRACDRFEPGSARPTDEAVVIRRRCFDEA